MPSSKKKNNPAASPQNFPVVGVGASAGGLDAFKQLLATIPENSGMAFVLVQHLSPSHESILPDILQRVTKIPVHEITDDIHLAPNHIYTIPSNKILIATDGVLSLSPREKLKTNLPINIFFTSLAEVHKELAAGVVLSGTGSDGTLGLKAIKEHGGITIAQDMQSAAYKDMPQHAVDAGVVDFILPPKEISAQLLQINNHYPKADGGGKEELLPKNDDTAYKQILSLLHQRSGVDFTYYKQNTIQRRIARRIGMRKKEKLSGYLKFLRSDKAEQDALFQDMLIPVTSFFRDPKTFDTLTKSIFPLVFKNRTADEPVRIWVAGCSTGEEAYSIAICLHEFFGEKKAMIPIQIFASDISERAIKIARAAIYTKADVKMFSDKRLQHYFRKTEGHYEVNKVIRDMCVFAPHNFLKDPPFGKIDLISCRNVLIYMDNFLQKKALTTFHYSLKQTGFLLLGKSETASASTELFTLHEKHHKIYSRKPVPGRFIHIATERREETLATQTKIGHIPEMVQTDFRRSGEAMLLNKYTPAAVIVNEQMDIVHIHGSITPFLEPSPGKPTFNLLKMAREGLGFELRNALHKAKTTNEPVTKKDIPSKPNGRQHLVTIEVVPLTNTVEPHYLILFRNADPAPVTLEKGVKSVKTKQHAEAQEHIAQLEKELSQAREDMRSISEEQEAANEELQSGNEELQSSNEEMQSLNEELETSKEELQSTNEELTIVNQELLDKQEQLNAARLYSESIITSIRHPLIVLDKNLRIKTASTSFYTKFNVSEGEIEGKYFYEIQNQQWDDNAMRSLLEKILPQKERLVDFEIIFTFHGLGERTMLLNARQVVNEKSAQKLILLAIEDITERKILENQLQESAELSNKERIILYNSFMNAPAGIAILKGDTHIFEFANKGYEKLIDRKVIIGKTVREVLPEIEHQGLWDIFDNAFATGEPFIGNELLVGLKRKEDDILETRYFNFVVQPLKDKKGNAERLLIHVIDVTEQVETRKQIEASEKRFSNILSQSLMAIAIFKGTEMAVTFANEPMLDILGKGNAVLNKPLLEGVPELKGQVFPKLLADVYTTGVPFEGYEIKAILKQNGIPAEVYFNFIYQPYKDVDDTITGITVLATDVTEHVLAKKQIEESANQLRFLAETIPQKIFTAKPDGNVDYFNSQWTEFAGLSFEKIRDWGWLQLIHPDDKKENIRVWQHAVDTGEPFRFQHRFRSKEGEYRWHLSVASPLRNEDGNIIKWFGTNTDIQEQKSFAEELETKVKERTADLQKSNEELKQTNLQLDQFAYIASHDLQEPLRKILTYSARLQDRYKDGLPAEAKTYLNKIEGASGRMAMLIKDMLNYSRLLQHEKLFVQTDLNETLKNILNDFELLIHEKKAEIKSEELLTIDAIPLQMNQLFYNLISNALKFLKEDVSPAIIITSRILSTKEIEKYPAFNSFTSYIEIIFKDNGIGFEQKYAQQIFTIFQRLNQPGQFAGTGIGLALSKKIIENHHGEIFVEAKENEGAEFHIILPVRQP